jgi:hypothetical protein
MMVLFPLFFLLLFFVSVLFLHCSFG